MGILMNVNYISKRYFHSESFFELKHTDICFEKGLTYVISGQSGSGKSTLLNILGGMEKPDSGKVYFKNKSIYDLSDTEQAKLRNNYFGFIFQFFNLIPELTIKENIELPKNFQTNSQITANDIDNISDELNIRHLLSKKPFQLSGGEQQRVAIARAIITNPEIIFADEPTGNLDNVTSKKIVDLLLRLILKRNTTLVIVTHDENLIKHEHKRLSMKNGVLKVEN